MRVTRYPRIRERLAPQPAGRLISELRDIAVVVKNLPVVTVSPDPRDNHLLAMAAAGSADFPVTGGKRDLPALELFEGTKMITVREFLALHGYRDGPVFPPLSCRPRPTCVRSLIG
jgi:uncharacterized protein